MCADGSERALAGALAGLVPDVVIAALDHGEPSALTVLSRDDLQADPDLWDNLRRLAATGRSSAGGSAPTDQGPIGSAPTTEER